MRASSPPLVASLILSAVVHGCAKPPPLEDAWEVSVDRVEALDKPKATSKVLMELRRGAIVEPLPGDPETFEREGKTLSYRRMRRLPEDHAGLVDQASVKPTKVPPVAYFCGLIGEGDDRRCALSLARTRLEDDVFLVFRPDVSTLGRVAIVDGRRVGTREVQGLRDVVVRTLKGKRYLFVESAVRKEARWTFTQTEIVAADRSLGSRLTVRTEEDDTRQAPRYLRTTLVVEGDRLIRRGTLTTLEPDGSKRETPIEEPLVF